MLLENNSYDRDVRVRQEAEALHAAGYEVTVIAPKGRKREQNASNTGVRVISFPAPPGGEGLLSYAIEYGYSTVVLFIASLYVLTRYGFDAIHLHNPPDTLFVIALLYRAVGKRVVYDHHDLAPELYVCGRFRDRPNKLIHRALLWLEVCSCRTAHHVIATNESYRAIDVERSGIEPRHVTVVRNGPEFRTLSTTHTCADDVVTIGYLGMIGIQDGVDQLISAMSHLVHRLGRKNVQCLIVGDGLALNTLREQTKNMHLAPYVTFVGWVDYQDVPDYVSKFDICAAPEPFNPYNNLCTMIKIMEYMAFGKPIVAFDLLEHRRSAGMAALYARTTEEYARHIAWLMDNPRLREEMGERGRERVEAELAWEHQAKALIKVYEQVLGCD